MAISYSLDKQNNIENVLAWKKICSSFYECQLVIDFHCETPNQDSCNENSCCPIQPTSLTFQVKPQGYKERHQKIK